MPRHECFICLSAALQGQNPPGPWPDREGWANHVRQAHPDVAMTMCMLLELLTELSIPEATRLMLGIPKKKAPEPVCSVCGHPESSPAHHLTPSQKGPPWYPAWDHPFIPKE